MSSEVRTSAHGDLTRWRKPPESCAGIARALGGGADADFSRSSTARSRGAPRRVLVAAMAVGKLVADV